MTKENKEDLEKEWISFLEWINYLSPWNFWNDHNNREKGLKPHIMEKLRELIDKGRQS